MKDQDNILTIKETERLCSLYIDCNLSVVEETELRYFLTQVDYHSPLIDEVRQVMNIETYISDKPFYKTDASQKHRLRKWFFQFSAVASFAVIIALGLTLFRSVSNDSVESQSYFIAYVDGKRLSDEEAKSQIEVEKKIVDNFIKEMSELEARQQQIKDNFFNP